MSSLIKRIKKNKTKLIIVGGIISTIYGAYRLSKYFQNYRQNQVLNNTLHFKILKAQYFHSMQTNSFKITKSLLKNLSTELRSSIDSENIALIVGMESPIPNGDYFDQINYSTLSAEKKLELWQKLKVLCLTKVTILILCWSYLTVTIHIQMSILAGHLFALDNAVKSVNLISTIQSWLISSKSSNHLDEDFQKEFINFTLTQLKQQIPLWISLVNAASLKVIGKTSLKRMMTTDDIIENLNEIDKLIQEDIFALCLQGIQLHNSNKRLEGPMYVTLMDTFQNFGLPNIEILLKMFKTHICERLNILGCDENKTTSKMSLAKFIPHIWTIFDSNSIMVDCVKEFCLEPNFHLMNFKTYESCMNS